MEIIPRSSAVPVSFDSVPRTRSQVEGLVARRLASGEYALVVAGEELAAELAPGLEASLEVGRRYRFQVEARGPRVLLRVLPDAANGAERDVRAAARLASPLGDVLGELVSALVGERASAGVAQLLEILLALVPRPKSSDGRRRPGAPRASPGDLGAALEALLAEVHEELPDGAARAAVARALARLAAEDELVATRRDGDVGYASLPLFDGERMTSLHLLVERRPARERGRGRESLRLSLGLELAHLGPLRADLWVEPGALAIRFASADAALVERLRRDAAALAERLAGGSRRVDVSAVLDTPADLDVRSRALAASLVRDGHLLDLEG